MDEVTAVERGLVTPIADEPTGYDAVTVTGERVRIKEKTHDGSKEVLAAFDGRKFYNDPDQFHALTELVEDTNDPTGEPDVEPSEQTVDELVNAPTPWWGAKSQQVPGP